MKTNKKELTVFALCAYAIPFLMMPLLYICLQNGRDTSVFANAQMFYPAAGVMLAFLLAKRPDMPMRFYILHITATALMLAMSVLSAFLPQEGWLNIANFVIIIASVQGWIFLLTEKKTKREDYGLRLHGKLLTALVICVYFLAVKTAMVFLSMAMQDIRLLLITFFLQFFPDLIKRNHVYILQTPLFRVRNRQKTWYCYSEEERLAAIAAAGKNPEITRFKGLGEISPDEFKHFIGKDIRLDPVTMKKEDLVKDMLEFYMGKNTMERQNFIIDNLVVEEDVIN